MENSKIEWTDHTFNPWIGCQHVSPGCDHCYAETQNAFRKWNGGTWGPHAPRKRTSVAYWKNPIATIKFISYEPALGPLRLPKHNPLPDWLISGGESGGGARSVNPQWVRDIIAECRQRGIATFHKQWGTYRSNPLVVEHGLSIKEAKALDESGKGGGLIDMKLVHEFPLPVR